MRLVYCMSHVTRHTSHVTRHTSHVTRHTSHVTRHTLLQIITGCLVMSMHAEQHEHVSIVEEAFQSSFFSSQQPSIAVPTISSASSLSASSLSAATAPVHSNSSFDPSSPSNVSSNQHTITADHAIPQKLIIQACDV